MHYLLKQEGFQGKLVLDQDIGTHFCDLQKMTKSQKSFTDFGGGSVFDYRGEESIDSINELTDS